ncbi:MAG: LPS-assembly protein LptD [Candidatus Pelagibacter sp.]
MKFNLLIVLLFKLIIFNLSLNADEIDIVSDNIKIIENGKIIKSIKTKATIKKKGVYIEGDYSEYNKESEIIKLEKNVLFMDRTKKITVETENAKYNQKLDILETTGSTNIKIEKKYEIESSNLIFDRKLQKIYSSQETTIKDINGNIYNLERYFNFDLDKEIITSKKTNIIDVDNNIYIFDNAKINLLNKEILGQEVRIDFVDDYFGVPNNDPILKGRSAISNNNETKIYKTVFSTCNTKNKSCPGWEIETEEFTHDKINKVFNYKNSWLKIFDQEIFYFPYFSHPDPTVKRKSGFLVPYYGSSNNFGSWVNIPYFKTLGKDKDITFNPRIYADDKFIMQSEYRQSLENSKLISDISYNNDGKNSNSHLFANLDGKIDKSSKYNFSYQSVTNDNYLKIHNLSNSSLLINDESVLTSRLAYSKNIDKNTQFKTDFIAYEDLSKRNNDRFQYILPNFTFTKRLELDRNYNGSFQFKSFGFQKNYDTNKYESLLVNDFLFDSNDYINNTGLITNYDFLIKNFNSYTENSTSYQAKEDYEVFGVFLVKTSLPLKKVDDNSHDYLKPIASFRYSPNNTKNISDKDFRLSYDNIFALNRIGTDEIVEGGKSISLGFEYERRNQNNDKLYSLSFANSISDRVNDNLPSKTKLNEERTDLVGKFSYYPNQVLNFDYSFSYDNNLKNSNYDFISTNINYNNLSTSFNFLSSGGVIGNDEIISNSSTIKLDNEKSLKFNIAKDLNRDFTEYYDLIYQYETDCLSASIEYNKKFYSEGNLKPEKNLFFAIKFIPFAEFRQSAEINQ